MYLDIGIANSMLLQERCLQLLTGSRLVLSVILGAMPVNTATMSQSDWNINYYTVNSSSCPYEGRRSFCGFTIKRTCWEKYILKTYESDMTSSFVQSHQSYNNVSVCANNHEKNVRHPKPRVLCATTSDYIIYKAKLLTGMYKYEDL